MKCSWPRLPCARAGANGEADVTRHAPSLLVESHAGIQDTVWSQAAGPGLCAAGGDNRLYTGARGVGAHVVQGKQKRSCHGPAPQAETPIPGRLHSAIGGCQTLLARHALCAQMKSMVVSRRSSFAPALGPRHAKLLRRGQLF